MKNCDDSICKFKYEKGSKCLHSDCYDKNKEFCSNDCLSKHISKTHIKHPSIVSNSFNYNNKDNSENDQSNVNSNNNNNNNNSKSNYSNLTTSNNNSRNNVNNNLSNNNNNNNNNNFNSNLTNTMSTNNDINILKKRIHPSANKDPNDYFYYKNFQVTKVGNQRQILGRGAFADVCLVKSKRDGKHYAMKIVEKKKLQFSNLIKEEINIHFSLKHNNIIKLFSFSETTEYFYLIMDFASKGTLYNKIKQQKGIEENECRDYFIQVINAISYMHKQGLAHRDIKPENLLIDGDNNIKLCDFGGAVKIEEGKERSTFFGTYEYMAPEVIEGNNYNCSVDIWALGILLYESLHGYSPFRVMFN